MKKIFLESVRGFQIHGARRFSAAIAYYTIFCLAPLFIFTLSILDLLLQDTSINVVFFSALQQLFGFEVATFLQENLGNQSTEPNWWVTVVGVILGLIGAVAILKELRGGLDAIFEVKTTQTASATLVTRHLVIFSTVIIIGLFVVLSLLSTMTVSIIGTYFQNVIALDTKILELINFSFSFLILTTLFMVLHTFIPATKIPFRLTLVGSLITALLFTLGKTLFGYYLATIGIRSGYGAAGSFVVLLLWIFYSAQIFFLGAEITAAIRKDKAVLEKIL